MVRYTERFEAVASFYRDTLGFRAVLEWNRGSADRGEILAPPGDVSGFAVEVLDQVGSFEVTDHCSFGIQVENVDAVHHHLLELGADIVKPPSDYPWGHRTLSVRDPDGFKVWIYQDIS